MPEDEDSAYTFEIKTPIFAAALGKQIAENHNPEMRHEQRVIICNIYIQKIALYSYLGFYFSNTQFGLGGLGGRRIPPKCPYYPDRSIDRGSLRMRVHGFHWSRIEHLPDERWARSFAIQYASWLGWKIGHANSLLNASDRLRLINFGVGCARNWSIRGATWSPKTTLNG